MQMLYECHVGEGASIPERCLLARIEVDETTAQEIPFRGSYATRTTEWHYQPLQIKIMVQAAPMMSLRMVLPVRFVPSDFPILRMLASIIYKKLLCRLGGLHSRLQCILYRLCFWIGDDERNPAKRVYVHHSPIAGGRQEHYAITLLESTETL